MKHGQRLENIESLLETLYRLVEAESLAQEVYPEALQEIRGIHDKAVKDIISIASGVFSGRVGLHGAGPKVPLEALERYFLVLRQAADLEWIRSEKLTRKDKRQARRQADHLARLAHNAALAVKVVAQARGLWSEEYRGNLEIDAWL